MNETQQIMHHGYDRKLMLRITFGVLKAGMPSSL
jgi:hypothetical protein